MEQTITLSSQVARINNSNNTPSDFTTVFDRPITLDRNKRAFMGLNEINTMTYAWYNVSREYNNDIIRYHNGKEYKIIALQMDAILIPNSLTIYGSFVLKTVI